jgi:hypothetical protein
MADTVPQHERPDPDDPPGTRGIRQAAVVGVGLIIAIFAALGIEGDTLTRLLRNRSNAVAWPLIVVVLAIGVSSLFVTLSRSKGPWRGRRLTIGVSVAASILLISICVSIWVGIQGLAERENPAVTISVDNSADPDRITIVATAPTLRSNEKMLLKVSAVLEAGAEPYGLCASPDFNSDDKQLLMLWHETGPSREGEATSTVSLEIPTQAHAVCVLATLWDRKKEEPKDDRQVVTILDTTPSPPSHQTTSSPPILG